jgi:hypothetical protein
VLHPGGYVFISTPNRFSLGPDPHIGVWTGGCWPRPLLAAYARVRRAIPPQRRLLSAGALRRVVTGAGFSSVRLSPPGLSPEQIATLGSGARRIARAYNAVRSLTGARELLIHIGPSLHAVAKRPAV